MIHRLWTWTAVLLALYITARLVLSVWPILLILALAAFSVYIAGRIHSYRRSRW